MDEMVALRCKYCGAPLDEDQVRSDSPYVTCQSCGTTQQRMDAKAYLDQLMGEVKSWLSTAMPMGFNIAGAENIDPIARHSIFTKDVKPKIELEMNEFRFSNVSLLGNCLIVLPFSTSKVYKPVHTASKAFEFNAKVRSVAPLAVEADSQELIEDASSLSQSYAMMINNIELLSADKEGRYVLMANNFTESANALKKAKGKEMVVERFEALATISTGIDRLLSGDLVNASAMIREGKAKLEPVKDKAFTSPEFGIMVQGITQEIAICDVLLSVIEAANTTSSEDPLKLLNGFIKALTVELPKHEKWGYILNDKSRMNEIIANMNEAMSARFGKGSIPVASGGGNLLIPFWDVDLRYSFETGALWKKKSVEVSDKLLVMADFVVDGRCLNDPADAVTDIFSERPKNGRFAGIKGDETSISNGSGLNSIVDSVSAQPAVGKDVALPLSTKKEAEKLCGEYLNKVSARIKKFKLSKPEVKRLIYVPCVVSGGRISSEALANMTPERLERLDVKDIIKN